MNIIKSVKRLFRKDKSTKQRELMSYEEKLEMLRWALVDEPSTTLFMSDNTRSHALAWRLPSSLFCIGVQFGNDLPGLSLNVCRKRLEVLVCESVRFSTDLNRYYSYRNIIDTFAVPRTGEVDQLLLKAIRRDNIKRARKAKKEREQELATGPKALCCALRADVVGRRNTK